MPNTPSQSATDPYGGAIAYTAPGVTPAAPVDGAPHVLTFFVPNEGTTIQLGASSGGPGGAAPMPGIRMDTATHIHMTAEAPATTISLGTQGGNNSEAAGISMYTAGDEKVHVLLTKDEHIVGHVETKYDAGQDKTITGELKKHVTAESTYTFDSKLGIESGPREEKVHGDWEGTIDGSVDWKAAQKMEFHAFSDHVFIIEGMHHKQVLGVSNELLVGAESIMIVGGKSEMIAGAGEMKVVAGTKTEVVLALETDINIAKWQINGERKEMHAMKHEVEGLTQKTKALGTVTAALSKETLGVDISDPNVRFMNTTAEIKSAAAIIYK